MKADQKEPNEEILNLQRAHWQSTFEDEPEMFGTEASYPAKVAAELFQQNGAKRILELGCGHGRDSSYFLEAGFSVEATDYSENGLRELSRKAQQLGLGEALVTRCHDIRQPLPFADGSFDACFSHMLFCMALGSDELAFLSAEIQRVLKPGGLNIYTARNIEDPDFETGVHRGEGMYELDGGFIVHFFDEHKVERLSEGYELESVERFEEGGLPKRLFLVTMRKRL